MLAGVGEDGHVASIFRNGRSADRGSSRAGLGPVVPVHDAPKPSAAPSHHDAAGVSTHARRVIVAAFGASKAGVVRDALRQSGVDTPVAELSAVGRRPQVLLDRDAAELS